MGGVQSTRVSAAVNQSPTDLDLAPNVFIADVLCQEAVLLAVYWALRFKAFVFC